MKSSFRSKKHQKGILKLPTTWLFLFIVAITIIVLQFRYTETAMKKREAAVATNNHINNFFVDPQYKQGKPVGLKQNVLNQLVGPSYPQSTR
tara:strand:- start:844 stop:1119 length:276 start_codon:yes stop_codon:yes gene_type:complete